MDKSRFRIQFIYENEEDFGTDEIGVNVIIDDKIVASYGDYYHDKGSIKAVAFIEGYCFAKEIKWGGKYESEEIADPNFI
jgi:hypothetical protein